jgi:hypothetical protein
VNVTFEPDGEDRHAGIQHDAAAGEIYANERACAGAFLPGRQPCECADKKGKCLKRRGVTLPGSGFPKLMFRLKAESPRHFG